jgi:hypothetical protein
MELREILFLVLAALALFVVPCSASLAAVDVSSVAGCGSRGGSYLTKGLTDCHLSGYIGSNTTLQFTFTPTPNATFNLLLILRTVSGEAALSLYAPGEVTRSSTNAISIFKTATAVESYLYLPAERLQAEGTHTLTLRTDLGSSPYYTISILTPTANLTLAPGQAQALAAIHDACCPAGGFGSSGLCRAG